VEAYIDDLLAASEKLAKTEVADIVSAHHVNRAAQFLRAGRRLGALRHLGTVGGVLLGAAISNVLAIATATAAPTTTGVIASISLGVVGAFLIALHIARDS
jgi:formate-dependent nitrite reductase membrane component NrfD